MEFNKHINLKTFEVGHMFGGSAILTEDDIQSVNQFKKDRTAVLSIVVCSVSAEVLVLDPRQYDTLPELL